MNPFPKPKTSVSPTYDSRETGPRYYVTTKLSGRILEFQSRIGDPFICKEVRIRISWCELLRRVLCFGSVDETVTVLVGGDADVVNDVLELDANQLVPGRPRVTDFHKGLFSSHALEEDVE